MATDNPWSFCAPAGCATGADCASGECGVSEYFNGCEWDVELECRSSTDACRSEADCATDGGLHKTCVAPMGSPWECKGWTCVLGRPLLVDGEARTAPPTPRDDWSASADAVTPDLAGLDGAARAALAAHWLEVGAAEHASVASFARFTLDLCAAGAPASLVAEAQRAGLDEVEHARLAYGLASAYAGRAVGPGPLAMGPIQVAADRMEMLRSLIEEACVGETLGVAEALALADAAERSRDRADPPAHRRRRTASRRARVEDPGVAARRRGRGRRAAPRRAGSRARWPRRAATLDRDGGEIPDRSPRIAGARALSAVRRQALREVVAPCAEALLGRAC